jgi:hypothetical protein
MHLRHLLLTLLVLFSCIGGALAVNPCDYNGSVNINKSDLPRFTRDQIGCGIQNTGKSMDILVICLFVLFGLVIIYGMWRMKKG